MDCETKLLLALAPPDIEGDVPTLFEGIVELDGLLRCREGSAVHAHDDVTIPQAHSRENASRFYIVDDKSAWPARFETGADAYLPHQLRLIGKRRVDLFTLQVSYLSG